jgi:hypothetical protein
MIGNSKHEVGMFYTAEYILETGSAYNYNRRKLDYRK